MNPKPLTKEQTAALTQDNIEDVKNLNCAFYTECLNVALAKEWPQFGCTECKAWQAMDPEQRLQDHYGLVVLRTAAENLDETGKCDRKRGARGNQR